MWICAICVVCIIAASVIFCKPYLGIAYMIIFIPFEGCIIIDGIPIYPLEVILAIIMFVCVVKLIATRENYFRNTKLIFFYLPFILCVLLSSLKFMELSSTIKEVVRWSELIVVYFLTINLINDDKKIRVILYAIVLTTALASICGTINFLRGLSVISWGHVGDWTHRPLSLFGNPNALAGYVNLTIPVLFGMLMTSKFLWERITFGIFAVLSIVTWFLTFSRSGWLSLILTMSLVFFLAKKKKRVALLSAILILMFAITFLSPKIRDHFKQRLLAVTSIELRAGAYPIGFNMVKDDLIFGIGIGNYPINVRKYPIDVAFTQNDLHNLYLQLFVEAGLLGICAFVFWLTGIIKYLISALKSLERSRDYYLFVGLMAGVIVYLFNNLANVLTVHGIHLQWGIILGLAVILTQFRESETCPKTV